MATGVRKKLGYPIGIYGAYGEPGAKPVEPTFRARPGAIYYSGGEMWVSKGVRKGWAKVLLA